MASLENSTLNPDQQWLYIAIYFYIVIFLRKYNVLFSNEVIDDLVYLIQYKISSAKYDRFSLNVPCVEHETLFLFLYN